MKGGEKLKQLILCVAALSLILGGIAFAQEQQEESTIVGPVMDNRYVHITPEDDQTQDGLSKPAQKLMDQGVIPAAEAARQAEQSRVVVQPSRNN